MGTRFLPQTKAMPKEMLPIVDKPIIQYVVEELVSVGIEDIVIVTGYHKRAVEDHFDQISADLRSNLKNAGKLKLLEETKKISELANFVYIRQKGPYGNGTPLVNAEHLLGDEPFIYTWSDDFIAASPPRFKQMINIYEEFNCPVMSAIRVTKDIDYARYGFAGGQVMREGVLDVDLIIEKPGKASAPSDLATVSGMLMTPEVFPYLHQAMAQLQPGQEFYYNDGLKLMIAAGKRILVCQIKNGRYYDAGNKLEYLKTVFDFALEDPSIGSELRSYIKQKL
ncbi:UTP--glucose-1-phosphate uridylyltransferase [Candidatus Saccharibacteria bacterium]|nr:UTP--glucose-1-phosphate uridylyltransferase [Candidatus Saccharibacteria bacterium]